MKKAILLCTLWGLGACVYAGEMDIWSSRRAMFDNFNSYGIDYQSSSNNLVKTEYVNERSFKAGEVLTAYKGDSVLSDKTFSRQFYVTKKIRAVGDVVLSNISSPYVYKNNQTFDIIGYVNINGVQYSLVPTDLENFVVLADTKNGQIYPQTGMIKNDRLILLRQDFLLDNKSFHFAPVFITKSEQTKPVKGFEIKYDGVRLDRIWFIYYDYSNSEKAKLEELSYPIQTKNIDINDVKIRLLSVGDKKIDYMIME